MLRTLLAVILRLMLATVLQLVRLGLALAFIIGRWLGLGLLRLCEWLVEHAASSWRSRRGSCPGKLPRRVPETMRDEENRNTRPAPPPETFTPRPLRPRPRR